MKKLLVMSFLLLVACFGFAQKSERLMGPAAKNAKPWQKKAKKSEVVIVNNRKMLKGPAAKNAKPWEKKDSSEVYVAVRQWNLPKLQGPAAKNAKPWELYDKQKVIGTMAAKRDTSNVKFETEQ